VTVLVSSCDRYSEVWVPFCHGMSRYWPDCPWPLQFVTNSLDAPCGKTIKVGQDEGWTKTIRKGLEKTESPIILFLLEDYWLVGPVDTAALIEFASIIQRGGADYILLNVGSTASKGIFTGDDRLYVFADDSRYRTALQASFWHVETLVSLLRNGENCWQFENAGSKRSEALVNRFLGVRENRHFQYVQTGTLDWMQGPVVKRRWTSSAKRYVSREGLDLEILVGEFVWGGNDK